MSVWQRGLLLIAGLTVGAMLLEGVTSPAEASYCDPPTHAYGGELEGQYVHYGVYATSPPQYLESLQSAYFVSNWIGLASPGFQGCEASSQFGSNICSMQLGYGDGTIGGFINPYFGQQTGEMEENSIYSYYVNWFPGLQDPEEKWVYIYPNYTQVVDGQTQYLMVAEEYNSSSGISYPGEAWMPVASDYEAGANFESAYSTPGQECASTGSNAYFGAFDNGTTNADTVIEASLDDSTWHDIYGWGSDTTAPYSLSQIGGDDAFSITGG